MLSLGCIGALWDGLLARLGFLEFPSGMFLPWLAPVWIIALWVGFATTLNVSLALLQGRWYWALLFGAVGGPLAYWAGMRLGGVRIPHDMGVTGHSDADVALHALVDAILGALAEGDIGVHFPPSDPQWRGASSDRFLAFAVEAHYTAYRLTTPGTALYGETGCDPQVGPCRVAWRDPPDLSFEHGVGPAFGLDVIVGGLTVGYRYVPAAASYGFPEDLHRISVGMGFL